MVTASIECCINVFSDEDGPVLPISEKLFQIIKCSADNWRQLDGVEREFGVKAQLSAVHPGPLCTDGFRVQCLKRFTDKTKMARAVKRCTKVGQPNPDSCINVPTSRKSARNVECSSSSKTSDHPREETVMCFQSSATFVNERKILRIHLPRKNSGKSSQFANTHQVSWK